MLADGRGYDAILCDLRMPDLDGEALYAWVAAERPDLCARTAFVTGDALSPSAAAFLARCGRPALEKPLAPGEVRRLVAALSAG
jgi:CheY-like chemotaxis protein